MGSELQPIQSRTANADLAGDATLRIVVEKHSRFYLNAISVRRSDLAPNVMEKIRIKREEFFNQMNLFKPLHELLWAHRIQIVTMNTVNNPL